MPNREFFSLICRLLTSVRVSMGGRPLFSARARGMASRADAKARMAYCSMEAIWNSYYQNACLVRTSELVYLVCSFGYCDCTADVGSAPTIYDPVVNDEVADYTNGIVQCSLSLVNNLVINTNLVDRGESGGNVELTILLLPRTNIVTARVFAHSSMTSILSRVVPKDISRTMPALPSFSAVKSSKRGTIRPCVAIAISCELYQP